MIKKKYFLLLSTLLLTVFLGLYTSSYAKILTQEEIENFCINALIFYNQEQPSEETIDKIQDADFSLWIDASRTYEGRWYIALSGNYITFGYYTGTSSNLQTYGPYIYNNAIYVNTSYLTGKYSRISRSSFASTSSFSNGQTSINSVDDRFFYTDCNLYSTSAIANATVLYPAGYSTIDNIFSNGESDYFTFLLNSNLNTITINGDSVPYIEHNTNQAITYVLGELGLSENFYNAELFTYRWQQGSWKLQNIRTLENIGPTTSNLIEVTIRGDWINPNTLYSLQMNPDPDSDFVPYSQPFFVKNRYTSITNGVLDLDNTFSGDYYNNYNNDTNTQDIINNTNDMSDVDNSLNEFISGDASDIANKFGFVMFSQEYYDFIYNTIVDIVGVLEETGDVYFDYSMHGESPTRIYSSSFTTPNGTLKNFITMFLISCTVFAFYKYIADILELISTGNILEALSEFKVDRNIFKM